MEDPLNMADVRDMATGIVRADPFSDGDTVGKSEEFGFFIALEGIDGSGTTTHSGLLKKFLEEKEYKVYFTHEPSALDIGKLIRKYLRREEVPAPVDALLFAADRVEHYYTEILPKLKEGYIVICDRFVESSIAYQTSQFIVYGDLKDNMGIIVPVMEYIKINGGCETKDPEGRTPFLTERWILEINRFVPSPDLTIILDLEPEIALVRKDNEDDREKFEKVDFLKRVREIYLKRARRYGYPVIGSGDGKEKVQQKIREIVIDALDNEKKKGRKRYSG